MARLDFRVRIIVAERPEFRSDAGKAAYARFEARIPEILRQAMNQARKVLRQNAPVRTRRLQRSLRVAQLRGRQARSRDGAVVTGYSVTTGRSGRLFYASITDRRQDTDVANWFTSALGQIQGSNEFKSWQNEAVRLFGAAIREEFRQQLLTSIRGTIYAAFRNSFRVNQSPGHTIVRADLRIG